MMRFVVEGVVAGLVIARSRILDARVSTGSQEHVCHEVPFSVKDPAITQSNVSQYIPHPSSATRPTSSQT